MKAMERGKLHVWYKVEFKAISRKHGLSVSGGACQGALLEVVPAVGGLLSTVPPAMEHSGGRMLRHWI